jgi:hypothetical protein
LGDIQTFFAGPEGPMALMAALAVSSIVGNIVRPITTKLIPPVAFTFVALIAARHFGFSVKEQYYVTLGAFVGLAELLRTPPSR